MPVEIKGQQLRIRVKSPSLFIRNSFRTQDVGKTGRLQRIGARLKSSGKWETQSWHLNLADYPNRFAINRDLMSLRIPQSLVNQAYMKVQEVL